MSDELERKTRLLWMIKEAINSKVLSNDEIVEVIKIYIDVAEEHGLSIKY